MVPGKRLARSLAFQLAATKVGFYSRTFPPSCLGRCCSTWCAFSFLPSPSQPSPGACFYDLSVQWPIPPHPPLTPHSTSRKANENSAVDGAVSQELCLRALGYSCIYQDKLCFIEEHVEAHRGPGILPQVTELVSEELGVHQGQHRWLFPGAHIALGRQAVAHCPQTGRTESARCSLPRAGLVCA